MKVTIKRCRNNNWWYKDKIGLVYNVLRKDIDGYIVNFTNQYWVSEKDCEVVDQIPDFGKKVGHKEDDKTSYINELYAIH